MRNLVVSLTIAGWLIITFSVPGIIVGIFLVLGTGSPAGLAVPVLIASFGWVLTRLDFKEQSWRKSLGMLITILSGSALVIICLLVTRNDSLTLAVWGTLAAAFAALGGVLLAVLSPGKQKDEEQRFIQRVSSS